MKVKLIPLVMALLAGAASAAARESAYTSAGKAPMYWMAYEECFVTDRALDESRWQSNINWVSEHLLPYGYDMVCTDGWIEGAQTIDDNGYITKYNSGWGQGFSFWVKYAAKKGLRSGVYYNPLWMSATAYDRDVTVKGTSTTTRKIAGKDKFNDLLYWVDTNEPGAEQWVKGYVRHFIELGFSFLRVDFLNMYENAYGSVRYRRALKWIEEEAGDEIMVSLVMPNCWERAKNERAFGDMFRISEDVFGGGFDFVSQRRRGQRQDGWANWGNLFDGFVDFSEIERSEILMDGDFVRLNTCAEDKEKEFWLSLLVMAGSPIAVADQYDSAGDNLKFYRNPDITSLCKEGFHGKPLSRDLNDENSSIWKGVAVNGDIVTGVFNREERSLIREITPGQLGVKDGMWMSNLWNGETTRIEDASVTLRLRLGAHECRLLRFSSSDPSGVDVAIEDSETAGFFTLDGVNAGYDANALPSGIYIKKTGNKTTKFIK